MMNLTQAVTAVRRERITAFLVAAGVLAQAAVLARRSPLLLAEQMQFCLLAVGLAVLVAQLWRRRRYLTPHADMLLLMFSLGGAGMILSRPGGVPCHATAWAETIQINGFMIAASLLPGVCLSRCILQARRDGTLVSTLTLDVIGMLAGMRLAALLSFAAPARWAEIVSHTLMIAGMMAGMAAAMITRELWSSAAALREAVTDVLHRVTGVLLRFCRRVLKLEIWQP